MKQNILFCDGNKLDLVNDLCIKRNVGIEIQTFYSPIRLDVHTDDQLNMIKNKIKKTNIKSLHGPFCELCPGSIDSRIRDVVVYRYLQIIDISKKLDINNIVLHHGYYPNTTSENKWINNFIETIQKILPEINTISIYFENLFETDGELICKVIREINHPQIKACLDIGHINCFSSKKPIEWFELLNNKIGYIHMHNNTGEQDSHSSLDDGNLNYSKIIPYINNYCPNALCAIETSHDVLERSLEYINNMRCI